MASMASKALLNRDDQKNFQKSKKFLTCGKGRGLFLVFQLLMLMMSTISTMPVPVMMMATVIIVLTLAATHDVKAAILHF